MHNRQTPWRLLLGSFAVTLTLTHGCRSTGSSDAADRTASPDGRTVTGESRSTTPLAKIEPVVSRPDCSESIPPLSERSIAQIEKARSLIGEQRYTEAAIQLERALRYDANHPRIHRTLATLHWEAGNVERARTHAQRAIEACADDAVAHYVAARCQERDDNRAGAIVEYRTALVCSDFEEDLATASLCHYQLANALAAEGYFQAALDQYTWFERRVTALGDTVPSAELSALLQANHGSAAAARASMLEQLGRYAEAADALAPIAGSSNDDAIRLLYGTLLSKADRHDEALAVARQMASNDDPVLDLLEQVYAGLHDTPGLLNELQDRLTRAPDHAGLTLRLAHGLAGAGRWDEGRAALESFLAAHPQANDVRNALIDLLIQSEAWEPALAACAGAIRTGVDRTDEIEDKVRGLAARPAALLALLGAHAAASDAFTTYLRGVLASADDRWDEARQWLERALELDADTLPARVALARLHLRFSRYNEALAVAARRDGDTAEDARLESVLGDIYERLDDVQAAERHYQAAIQLKRDDTDAMLALAELYRQRNELSRAQRQLRVLLDNDPNHDVARESLTFILLSEGKLDLARQEFEDLAQRTHSPHVAARCKAFVKQLQTPDAAAFRESLLAAIEAYGPDATTWLRVADSYAADTEADLQHDAYRHALAAEPDNEEAALGFVRSAARSLRFEEAAERFASLLPRRPNRHDWRLGYVDRRYRPAVRQLGLIELYWIIEDYDAAYALSLRGASLTDLDDSTKARYRLGVLESLHLADRDADALEQLDAWTTADPDDRGAALMLADELLRQSKLDEAVALLERLHNQDPENRALLATLIGSLVEAQHRDRAAQLVLDLVTEDADSDAYIAQLALVLAESDRVDDGLELLRNRLLHTFDRERFQDMTVALLAEATRYDVATEYVESLLDAALAAVRGVHDGQVEPADAMPGLATIALHPNEPYTLDGLQERMIELRVSLSGLLITGRSFDAALELLTDWAQNAASPAERIEYLRRLSFCYQGLGNEDAALEALTEALAMQPGNVTFNNDVAYAWIDRGERIDQAEGMIRYAVARTPRQSAYLDTYGWLLYKKGTFAEAKKWLLRANRARGGADPVIRDHLGDVLWRLGEKEAAVEQWQAAVDATKTGDENGIPSADERRVRERTPQKIEAAGRNVAPPIAPTASPATGVARPSGSEGSAD